MKTGTQITQILGMTAAHLRAASFPLSLGRGDGGEAEKLFPPPSPFRGKSRRGWGLNNLITKKNKHMKQTIYVALIACTVAILFTTCKKSETKTYPKENPLAKYLDAAGFDLSGQVWYNTKGGKEIGLWFTPLVTGRINAVTIKLPSNRNNVEVTLWEVSTPTIGAFLQTITIRNVSTGEESIQALDIPLPLTKNKQYVITFSTGVGSTNASYHQARTEGNIPYPIIVGNIRIDKHTETWKDGNDRIFPTDEILNEYTGNCSFVFQQTEQNK
jgi:hypothetical protein